MNINETAKNAEIDQAATSKAVKRSHVEIDQAAAIKAAKRSYAEIDQAAMSKTANRSYAVLPLYLLVPLLFWAAFHSAGYAMDWKAFGLGALGWTIAFVLRGPIGVLVKNMPQERVKNIMAASSGVLEESVRLIVLALTSMAAGWTLSVGQGWAAIEVVFAMIHVVVIASLVNRTDEKAMQAKQLLAEQGTLHANPLLGVLERIWASAFHIGAALIVASQPWTVILLIPLHSGFNWFAVHLIKRSITLSSVFVATFGIAVLGVGLTLMM